MCIIDQRTLAIDVNSAFFKFNRETIFYPFRAGDTDQSARIKLDLPQAARLSNIALENQ